MGAGAVLSARWSAVGFRALAIVLGLPLGFFLVLGPLFTDGPGLLHAERLGSLALAFGAYLVAAALLGLARPRDRLLPFLLAAAAFVLVVLYVARESQAAGLAVAYLLAAVGGGLAGLGLAGLRGRARVRRAG